MDADLAAAFAWCAARGHAEISAERERIMCIIEKRARELIESGCNDKWSLTWTPMTLHTPCLSFLLLRCRFDEAGADEITKKAASGVNGVLMQEIADRIKYDDPKFPNLFRRGGQLVGVLHRTGKALLICFWRSHMPLLLRPC